MNLTSNYLLYKNSKIYTAYDQIDYYPFGMERSNTGQSSGGCFNSGNNPYLYNGKEIDRMNGLNENDYGGIWYDAAVSQFPTPDPLCEKYYNISPYAYCAGNPVRFFDLNGQEIWMNYFDGNGNRIMKRYEAGMDNNVDNDFISACIDNLNKMNSTDIGKTVLDNLIDSHNIFNIVNIFPKDDKGNDITSELSFTGSAAGGGELKAGALVGNNLISVQKLSSIAHELFHGFQYENGENDINSGLINREIGAYLYGEAVSQTYQYNTNGMAISFPFGNETNNGKTYEKTMNDLLTAKSFNQALYNIAGSTFINGSVANGIGTYKNSIFNPNCINPLIRTFYPLIRF